MFLRVDPKIESMLIDEVKCLEGVKDAHYIYGPYDMYVEVEIEDLDRLQDIILNQIRNLYGVISTTTCYVADSTSQSSSF